MMTFCDTKNICYNTLKSEGRREVRKNSRRADVEGRSWRVGEKASFD
jgi:hypothetical protein